MEIPGTSDFMRFTLIIFDCDGVLVDSEPIVNRVFVEMLAESGYTLDYETTLREFSGGSTAKRLEVTTQRWGWSVPAGFVADYEQRVSAALRSGLRPVPGVREALAQLQPPWCVASNGTRRDISERLELAGLLATFTPHLFSAAEDVQRRKPHPDVFLHAAQSMGVEPAQCAVIEDSCPGVEAAVRAGMPVFGFARLTAPQDLRAAGAHVFTDMMALPQLLRIPRQPTT